MTDLPTALADVAGAPRLLVGVDFDGTLAPLVDDPSASRALPGSMAALRRLAEAPGVRVCVVSGRSVGDLAMLLDASGGLPSVVTLVGSHGAEIADDGLTGMDAERESLLRDISAALEGLAATTPGARVEVKPASATLHVRGAVREEGERVLSAARSRLATLPGVHLTEGKDVVELSVVETSKGTAMLELRRRADADAVVFVGDDTTDERAFAVLRPDDVGIHVGDGPTLARFTVRDPHEVTGLLEDLLAMRSLRV